MNIDIRHVPIRKMEVKQIIQIPSSYYKKTDIIDITDIYVEFSIFQNANQEDVLKLHATGSFVFEDARTLLNVEDPFVIDFETILNEESDFCGSFLANSQNTLDILEILWENIVLEIPISFTVSDEIKSVGLNDSGGNYKEGKNNIDPRMAPLMDLLDKEKE